MLCFFHCYEPNHRLLQFEQSAEFEFFKNSPLLSCSRFPLLKFPSFTVLSAAQKHKNFTRLQTFCNTRLQSVLACTVSSALLGCSVAPCVGHVSSPPSSPPLPFPSSSPPSPSSCLLAAPRRSTRDFTNPPSCSQLDLTCHI